MLFLKMAWRNIWRNRSRTLITTASVLTAVALGVFSRSQQEGTYENMIGATIGSFMGAVQVHQQGYWAEQNLDNSMAFSEELIADIRALEEVQAVVPRLETFALLAGQEKTRACLLMGIDPEAEKQLANPEGRLVSGSYFSGPQDGGVLLAEGLATYLGVQAGDSVVLIGQGYQGNSAVGRLPIRGIFKFASPQLNRMLAFIPLLTAWEVLAAEGRITSIAVQLPYSADPLRTVGQIRTLANTEELEVMSWQEMTPELVQMIESDKVSGRAMMWVLYLLVGFGIFGTILMMTAERRYEFGVLLSVGMKRLKLGGMVMMETLLLGIAGISAGSALILPVIGYLHFHPIRMEGEGAKLMEEYGFEAVISFAVTPSIFLEQSAVVLSMTALIALYPLWVALRLRPVKAMRG